MNNSYALLVQCTRLTSDEAMCAELGQTTAVFKQWSSLIPLAEQHSLAPLLYTHFQQCQITLPSAVKLALQGLTLRHQQANELRTAVLAHILQICQAADIQALVLKGAALAALVYPRLGLRPMSDLDILVQPQQAAAAQQLLLQQGYQLNPHAEPAPADHRHLPVLMVQREGLTVSIEIHRSLASGLLMAEGKPFAQLWATAVPFSIQGQTAYSLGPADMLWHLYHHASAEHTRLIRLLDLTAVAEQYANDIDWTEIRQTQPEIIAALSNLHYVAPLSDNLRQKAGIQLKQKPAGAALALHDWPPLPRVQWSGKSRRHIWQHTFMPSEFSLRFYYGIPNHQSCWRQRWLTHPLQVGRWWWQRRVG